jgi:prepilin-type N-terminal cleavage/methylation domain-containing protein
VKRGRHALLRKGARGPAGFTLVELLIAVGASGIVLGALAVATTSLAKSFDAMETYSRQQAASVRVMDAIAMDLRRASGVAITTSSTSNPNAAGNTTAKFSYSTTASANVKAITDGTFDPVNNRVGGRANPSTYLTLTLPGFYQANDPTAGAYRSRTTLTVAGGDVRYGTSAGAAADVTVQYRKAYHSNYGSECIIRREGGIDRVIAEKAEYLDITLTAQTGNAFLVQTSYIPTFSSARRKSTHRVAASDRVMLRNPRRD